MSDSQHSVDIQGLSIRVGRITSKETAPSATVGKDASTFHEVQFDTPLGAGMKVVVIPMAQTFNGPQTPGLRISDVSTTGFKYRMNELVVQGKEQAEPLSDGKHVAEHIGWLALGY